jgi:hypothetical protein
VACPAIGCEAVVNSVSEVYLEKPHRCRYDDFVADRGTSLAPTENVLNQRFTAQPQRAYSKNKNK